MPRKDSQLQQFLLTALRLNTFGNLNWLDPDRRIFILHLFRKPRRGGGDHPEQNNQIFKDWDSRKGHVYDPSRSRNRLLVSMKNSSYLKKINVSSSAVTYQFCTAKETNDKKREKKEEAERKIMQLRPQIVEMVDVDFSEMVDDDLSDVVDGDLSEVMDGDLSEIMDGDLSEIVNGENHIGQSVENMSDPGKLGDLSEMNSENHIGQSMENMFDPSILWDLLEIMNGENHTGQSMENMFDPGRLTKDRDSDVCCRSPLLSGGIKDEVFEDLRVVPDPENEEDIDTYLSPQLPGFSGNCANCPSYTPPPFSGDTLDFTDLDLEAFVNLNGFSSFRL